jgi:transposase
MAKTPTRFISPLTEEQREQLWSFVLHGTTPRIRHRAHAVVLSDLKKSVDEIAEIFRVSSKTASSWLDRWEESGLDGLDDASRPGGPPKLTDDERQVVVDLIGEFPQSPKTVLNEIPKRIGKTVSSSTLKRIARRSGLRWKRMRRSLKSRRDEREFRLAEDEIRELVHCHEQREIDLYFFDEAGFSLVPTVPYAWQRLGERLEIPSRRSKQLNVLGFLGIDHRFWCNTIEGCVDSCCVVGCIDEFCKTLVHPTVVVMDNASVHKNSLFEAKSDQWADKGLFFYFLPPYSPELNLIERLWRMIKYHWLPTSAYESFKTLVASLHDVLRRVGSQLVMNHSYCT